MIRYSLTCSEDHAFDSWFQSVTAYDLLAERALVVCPVCGSTSVSKSLMAPAVQSAGKGAVARPLAPPATGPGAAMAELRRKVEETSEYVGVNFAAEARRIHAGDAPERPIFGEARLDEAKKLIEDGVPVAPLPFLPTRRTN